MKFLIDAQLPRQMVGWFNAIGCDAIHTLDLPRRNRTPDEELVAIANRDQRVLATKDSDFVDSHLLFGRPAKLLLVSTGNISNQELEQLAATQLPVIVTDFQTHTFLELSRTGITIRG